ncbi:hypothetical protein NE237_013338 [Protea cynaroides]|uniref:RING-type E3 ubiquitin transferase n=1 Tax=Protea cynaroides TaxID=273540 RepID=A0A9Q0JZP8_9MAGN|nr:hypothetical protein NE237_013338 [Protea cynaroides]
MGICYSKRRRRRNNNSSFNSYPSQLIYSSPAPPPSSNYHPPPLQPSIPSPAPPNYFFAANAPYNPLTSFPPQNSYPAPNPAPQSSSSQYAGGSNDPSYYADHDYGLTAETTPEFPSRPPETAPPHVDHQNATKVKNDVNVRKDTIKLEIDEFNPDCHLVSFTFDAMADGSITIFYFAKEGANCSFSPLYPEAYMPVRIPFRKGLGQKFRQVPGTGIDLGFFELDDLFKPSMGEDVFPLVILAQACLLPQPAENQLGQSLPLARSSHAQITQAVLAKNNGGPFQASVVKQILWVDGVRYELREIYGIGNSVVAGFDDNDQGMECVICMTEPKDTAVLPCRHLCMCRECAIALRDQSNKCPICRQAIQELIEI